MKTEIATEAAYSAPPALIVFAHWAMDVAINNPLGVLTGVYICMQMAFLMWRWKREANR